jgi:nucleotide-binding universal stress UspA family protein
MKTIAVGYDGSDASKRALERAATLAEALKAKLVVVSVAELIPMAPDAGMPGDAMGLASPAVTPVADQAEADREIHSAHTTLAGRGIEAEYVTVVGDPADGLIEEADRHEADLIVVGTRHAGFLGRLFGGDVGEAVSRRGNRDVLIVH